MTWCTTCGTEGSGPACPRCGAPYPPAAFPQPTPVDAGDTLLAPTAAWGAVPTDPYPPQPPPPAYAAYAPLQPGTPPVRTRRPLLPFLAGALAIVALTSIIAFVGQRLLGPAPVTATTPVTITTTTRTPSAAVTPTLAGPGTSVAAPPAPPATSAAPAAAVTVTRTVVAPTGADALSATYVMVLESLDKNTSTLTQARTRAAALASASGRAPKVLDSSATAGMNPGYWAIVDGPHPSESAARASCAAYGRTQGSGECYLRVLG